MVDLDHLEALDDDAPPPPDLGQVRSRAGRLRRRNRLAVIGSCVAVLAVAVGVVAIVHTRDHSVEVVGPSGSTTVPTTAEDHPTVSGTLPDGLRVDMTLETPTVVLGSDVRATVVLRNPTSTAKVLGGGDIVQCAVDLAPVLRDQSGHEVATGADAFCDSSARSLPPGDSRTVGLTLSTGPVEISAPQRGGRYELTLVKTSGEHPPWTLGPVPVEIVVPELGVRLETPRTTYPSSYSLDGTIVFDNRTGAPIEYQLDCFRTPPWEVLLSKDGTLFEIAHTLPKCRGPRTTEQLQPGENRLPFVVNLGYPECVGAGEPRLTAPRCVDGGIPDLAPGTYQLVFRGEGAPLTGVEAAPLTIEVTARPGG